MISVYGLMCQLMFRRTYIRMLGSKWLLSIIFRRFDPVLNFVQFDASVTKIVRSAVFSRPCVRVWGFSHASTSSAFDDSFEMSLP